MKRFLALTLLLSITASSQADVLILKDGSKIEGDFKKTDDGYLVTGVDGKQKIVPADQVQSIELKPSTGISVSSSGEKFASLKRAIDNGIDPKSSIERYQQFIQSNPGKAEVVLAQREIALWQDRQNRKLIKWANQWIESGQVVEFQKKSMDLSEQGRQFLKQGRLKDADTVLQQALVNDPICPTALYLRGVLLYRQDQLWPARKCFEAVNQSIKDHPPTLINLAVILYRQKQYPQAMGLYDQAMMMAPKDKLILNNVAEALNDLPDRDRGGIVVQKAQRHFSDQDNQLQQELTAQGWFRWGATWVTQAELDRLRAAEKEVHDKLDAMAGDFQTTRDRIDRIDREIDETERSLRRIEASSYARDTNGNMVRISYPPVYHEMQDDINRLRGQRAGELAKLDQLKENAKAIQKRIPTPRYTGVQRLIEMEGTPLVVLAGIPGSATTVGATQPTSRPSSQPSMK